MFFFPAATALLIITFSRGTTVTPPVDDFCTKLKSMLESAHNGFNSIKGAPIERMITGSRKNFFVSKTKFVEAKDCYVSDVSAYPECECILSADSRITPKLTAEYQRYKKLIEECLPKGWVLAEQDSSNNEYLKDTPFKKLTAREEVSGKKVKFHLYMYSSMIEKSRVVELKIEGIGTGTK